MSIDAIFVLIAKSVVGFTFLFSIVATAYLGFEWWRIRKHRESSEVAIAATYYGLAGFVFVTALVIWTSFQYSRVQVERREQLLEVRGISDEIDKRVDSSVGNRISYLHTQQIRHAAIDFCEASRPGAPPQLIGKCSQLLASEK